MRCSLSYNGQLFDMSAAPHDKASNYVTQLYEARCSGWWQAVPELARKVEKHVPRRKCLVLAARAGAIINTHSGVEAYRLADKEFGLSLAAALQEEQPSYRDFLDATICRAAIYMGQGNREAALEQVAEPLHKIPPPTQGSGPEGWSALCVVQGTLIRGLSLEARGDFAEATSTYRSIISYVSNILNLPSQCTELRRWTEELLSHLCIYFSSTTDGKSPQLGETMATFHLLSAFLEGQSSRLRRTYGTYTKVASRTVWRVYYEALSKIVMQGLVYHPSPIHRDHNSLEHKGLLEDEDFFASRVQQRAELKKVEASYESLLMQETRFPKANERNEEVESWVELVMANWRTLCGPSWTDEELGSGGKLGVGRSTLDILYRATEKTFHSTAILRHLFTLHTYLADFYLAFRIFDTYAQIMTKGKARDELSDTPSRDIDDNETALRFAAEAVKVACRYGSRIAADKALTIGNTIQQWMGIQRPDLSAHGNTSTPREDPSTASKPSNISPETLALCYYAIGISQANNARVTYDPSVRKDLRNKAALNFRKALEQGLPDMKCTDSLFALALVLAELREVPEAINVVKRGLATDVARETSDAVNSVTGSEATAPGSTESTFEQARRKMPMLHLLGLLLTAREDFDTAGKSFENAFEQLSHLANLFGDALDPTSNRENGHSARSSVVDVDTARIPGKGVLDNMESLEKETVVEIKMTQLSLLEVMEGPEHAVNASNTLLALYAQLFDNIDTGSKRNATDTSAPPKSSHGTIRSMLGRSKSARTSKEHDRFVAPALGSASATTPDATTTPTIQVMNEHGTANPVEEHRHRFTLHRRHEEGKPLVRGGSLKRHFPSIRKHHDPNGSRPNTSNVNKKRSVEFLTPVIPRTATQDFASEKSAIDGVGANTRHSTARQSLEQVPHGLKEEKMASSITGNGERRRETRSSLHLFPSATFNPAPQFVHLQKRRQQVSLLIRIWLFIAKLYTEAAVFDDAKEAVEEARKLIEGFELDVAQEESSSRNFQAESWGGGKSVDELWADVFTARGQLLQSQSLPHDARDEFEEALFLWPDHPQAIVGLSEILLDMYCQIIPADKPEPGLGPSHPPLWQPSIRLKSPQVPPSQENSTSGDRQSPANTNAVNKIPSPFEIYRLTKRDRACALLASLVKLEEGWDYSEAWLMLARAYEESGQIDKAKDALWWTVQLEDQRPLRHWKSVNPGGYVL